MSRGDRVDIVVEVADGVERHRIEATLAGGGVEVSSTARSISVREVTRTGDPVRIALFNTQRVVSLVETPHRLPRDGRDGA